MRKSLRTGLKQIIDRVGITAIFVTHDQVGRVSGQLAITTAQRW